LLGHKTFKRTLIELRVSGNFEFALIRVSENCSALSSFVRAKPE
jgi:hypothetical protein